MGRRESDGRSAPIDRSRYASLVRALGDSGAALRGRRLDLFGRSLVIAAALGVLAAGAVGSFRYVNNFRLYRGYPPPRDPSFVRERGHLETIHIASPALGGRRQRVLVYLPPGYLRGGKRYPVLYLLHGSPGSPEQFLNIVRAGIVVDELVARRQMGPLILVMPFGSTGTFVDKQWVDGVRPHEAWGTFVARDVVQAMDARYQTIGSGAGRAIAGLSEGGYGAINIAIHHPGEFRVIESWSGYERAASNAKLFGRGNRLLRYNSPLDALAGAAPALRRAHTFFWLYCGRRDPLCAQNAVFATQLSRERIAHRLFTVPGRHDWRLWRNGAAASVLAAERVLRSR